MTKIELNPCKHAICIFYTKGIFMTAISIKPLFRNVTVTLIVLLSAGTTLARLGADGSGGGDLCEDRIQQVRDDIKAWIEKAQEEKSGGPYDLILPPDVSPEQYITEMLKQIKKASIKCVGPKKGKNGTIDYDPVKVDGVPKACRFDRRGSRSKITCDYLKFNAESPSEQYKLVHHEYAGLANIEVPKGSVSNYDVSKQISEFLVDVVVKKLAIKKGADYSNSWRHIPKISDMKQGNYAPVGLEDIWDNQTCGLYVVPNATKNEITMVYSANPSFPVACDLAGLEVTLKCPSGYAADCRASNKLRRPHDLYTKIFEEPLFGETRVDVMFNIAFQSFDHIGHGFDAVSGEAFRALVSLSNQRVVGLVPVDFKNTRYVFHDSGPPTEPKYFPEWTNEIGLETQDQNCAKAKQIVTQKARQQCFLHSSDCQVYKEVVRKGEATVCGYGVMVEGK